MQEKNKEISLIKRNILKYAEYKGVSKYEVYQKTGISRSVLSQNNGMTEDNLLKFLAYYSDVNIEWLLTGNGQMLKQNAQKLLTPASGVSSENADSHDKYNENLQITKIHKTTKYMEKILESQEIPLYDIRAAANLKTLFTEKNQNILGNIKVPNISKCDGAMYVTGDSMDPIIKSGDIICYKEIYDFTNIIYGQMYLVAMDVEGEEFLTIKYITRSESGKEWICLQSHNPLHSPQDFDLKCVNALALIKVSIRMNIM